MQIFQQNINEIQCNRDDFGPWRSIHSDYSQITAKESHFFSKICEQNNFFFEIQISKKKRKSFFLVPYCILPWFFSQRSFSEVVKFRINISNSNGFPVFIFLSKAAFSLLFRSLPKFNPFDRLWLCKVRKLYVQQICIKSKNLSKSAYHFHIT